MGEFTLHITETIDHIVASLAFFRPELVLTIGFVCSILVSLFVDRIWKHTSFVTFFLTVCVSGYAVLQQHGVPAQGFFGMIRVDDFAVYARLILLAGVVLSGTMLWQYIRDSRFVKKPGDLFTVLIATTLGLHLLTITTHWLLAFIAIEMVSIGSYIMVSYFSETKKQSEAAMKYVLFGAVCAAFMLYGLSLLYGFTGDLDFASASHMKGLIDSPMVLSTIALLFVFVGIGFKLGFVPFHMWTPDVYEGAPTPVTAFLSTVPKVGAIVLFCRIVEAWTANPFYFGEVVFYFVFFVAVVTMLIGNLIALRQQNAKRLMAYSSIGHTGFMLMAMLSYLHQEQEIFLFYVTAYVIMNLSAFGFIYTLEQRVQSAQLSDYAGLGKKWPLLFGCFTLVGVSLVGLPPTVGFIGKLTVLTTVFDLYQSMDERVYLLLLVVGVATSAISLFFYLKVPLYAFLREEGKENRVLGDYRSVTYVVAVALSVLVFIAGLFPQLLFGLC